jgi:hypothetical protein
VDRIRQRRPRRVRYARSLDGGASWGAKKALSPKTQAPGFPAIARDGSGRVAVAWTDANTGRVNVKVSTDGGSAFGSTQTVATTSHQFADAFPTLAISARKIHIAYYANDRTVAHRRSGNNGASWSSVTRVTGGGDGFFPHLAAASNTVIVGYTRYAPTFGDSWVASRRSTDGGATWAAEKSLSSKTGKESALPILSQRGGVWRAAFARCTDVDCTQVAAYHRASSDGGLTWTTAARVSPAEHDIALPVGINAAGGKTLVGWVNYQFEPGTSDVYTRRAQ